ncbi:MAG TPA: hypothetical protein VGU61_13920 [Noviherbaspirillum sp.]|jgi:hypothetical protein|uniref:hypothetical protein n=1 Tax=Noviherbaspirillum sp. TaxID=1926288 RepID=UPI002DDCBBEB|nr:hypothetical protein [Noviherbaspirillum sp.]HEV2611361.1 hypothetical protein [Noviherbaspirillum sp.]
MAQHHPDEINRLITEFMDMQEAWNQDQERFDWGALEALAQRGAHAYNEGTGPSFPSLALDGMRHSELHERFLASLLQAGFDPFKTTSTGDAVDAVPVIDHASLAEAAETNPTSARMRATLMDLARERFEPLARDVESGQDPSSLPLYEVVKACAESVPDELMRRIAPELASRDDSGNGLEEDAPQRPGDGFLSSAEAQVENRLPPVG